MSLMLKVIPQTRSNWPADNTCYCKSCYHNEKVIVNRILAIWVKWSLWRSRKRYFRIWKQHVYFQRQYIGYCKLNSYISLHDQHKKSSTRHNAIITIRLSIIHQSHSSIKTKHCTETCFTGPDDVAGKTWGSDTLSFRWITVALAVTSQAQLTLVRSW